MRVLATCLHIRLQRQDYPEPRTRMNLVHEPHIDQADVSGVYRARTCLPGCLVGSQLVVRFWTTFYLLRYSRKSTRHLILHSHRKPIKSLRCYTFTACAVDWRCVFFWPRSPSNTLKACPNRSHTSNIAPNGDSDTNNWIARIVNSILVGSSIAAQRSW